MDAYGFILRFLMTLIIIQISHLSDAKDPCLHKCCVDHGLPVECIYEENRSLKTDTLNDTHKAVEMVLSDDCHEFAKILQDCKASCMPRGRARTLSIQQVDCQWSLWREDGKCSVTCGSGKQHFIRSKIIVEKNGGYCDNKSMMTESCVLPPCPVDGKFGRWGSYSKCSKTCGTGYQKRERKCNNPPPSAGGKNCIGPREEAQECNINPCPVNGKFGLWGSFSKCTKTCGGGTQKRERKCNSPPPSAGGKNCVGPAIEIKDCNTNGCPVNCKWSTWNEDKCSTSCGNGIRLRRRSKLVKEKNGGICEGHSNEREHCNVKDCPVDCEWGEWQIGDCSVSCDGGKRRNKRVKVIKERDGGKCEGSSIWQEYCNTNACPTTFTTTTTTLATTVSPDNCLFKCCEEEKMPVDCLEEEFETKEVSQINGTHHIIRIVRSEKCAAFSSIVAECKSMCLGTPPLELITKRTPITTTAVTLQRANGRALQGVARGSIARVTSEEKSSDVNENDIEINLNVNLNGVGGKKIALGRSRTISRQQEGEKPGPHCKGPPTFGSCQPLWPRGFTFDPVSKTCKNVYLSGCGLTNNGFLKLEECEAKCRKINFVPKLFRPPKASARTLTTDSNTKTDGINCCREKGVPDFCFGYCLAERKNTKSRAITGFCEQWLKQIGHCKIVENSSCTCKDMKNRNNVGNCEGERPTQFNTTTACYVNLPSTCSDLKESITNPGEMLSIEACNFNLTFPTGYTFKENHSCSNTHHGAILHYTNLNEAIKECNANAQCKCIEYYKEYTKKPWPYATPEPDKYTTYTSGAIPRPPASPFCDAWIKN